MWDNLANEGEANATSLARKMVSPVGGVESRFEKKEEKEKEGLSDCNW